ncbi:MAG: lipoyl synthase [Acidimicrobiia bacterium]|nr:lipoyl synthase [Acidimicrobiia bacterium]
MSSVAVPASAADGAAWPVTPRPLRVRWLGRVAYRDALALQRALFASGASDHLLLLEHEPVFTLGIRGGLDHLLVEPAALGADIVRVDRGGDVTYHGPGQLVGYPVLSVPGKRGGGMADTAAYVHGVEQVLIDALADLGLAGCGRRPGETGVWVGPTDAAPRKIAAIGVKLTRARSMHGFALNVDDRPLDWFGRIVPCGIADKAVTSLASEGVVVSMADVVDAVAARAAAHWAQDRPTERADVAWRVRDSDLSPFSRGLGPGRVPRPGPATRPEDGPGERVAVLDAGTSVRLRGRLAEAGVTDGLAIASRKPAWMRVPLRTGPEYRRLKRIVAERQLVTVCEEAGCPNIFECWNDGTATFMINGERCTRRCGFCLVDTSRPGPLDGAEPGRVADAVATMGLSYAVVTAVARDDLDDGGASGFVATIAAIRSRVEGCRVEVLIPDCGGDEAALDAIFVARPDVLNHNIETVARLQRAVRPSAGYARSLAVLGRAKASGLVTKSSIIVGMGETDEEVDATLADLAAVGTDIVTVGQYLRPTTHHLPIARWVPPGSFERWRVVGASLGIGHVEASPLTRSSYHARDAADGHARRP